MAGQKPDVAWSKQDQQDFQNFLDDIRARNPHSQLGPLIKDDNTGFHEGAVSDPTDPTLLATDERVHPGQITHPVAGDKGVHPEVLEGGLKGAGNGDLQRLIEQAYGELGHTLVNNRPLVMPRSGSMINTPGATLPHGPAINVPTAGLPGGGSLITGLGFGKAPGGNLTLADLLAKKAQMMGQAHGHGIVQKQMVA